MTDDDLVKAMRDRVAHPARVEEIARLLRIPRLERPALRRQLRTLAETGSLVRLRGHLFAPARLGAAAPSASPPAIRRTVGRLERDRRGQAYVVPFDRRTIDDILVGPTDVGGAGAGEMVTVDITQPAAAGHPPRGRVREVLGLIDDPGVDVEIILRKHEIPDPHGPDAVAEAERLGADVSAADLRGRTDFRDRPVVTIDGEHARDFDDAISIARLPNGHYWLGVHIADVSHYVAEGSVLDREAFERGTSVYFPDRAVHMFPAALATGLCSLNPGVDRLVQSCLMEVDGRGEVVRHEIHDGVIRSTARMTYTAVDAILTARDPDAVERYRDLVPAFALMHQLFGVLNERRRRRGSVDFDLPEPEVILDPAGFVADIVASERNVAHRIIEEFMLLANETVARHLEDAGMPSLYRVHEPPDPVKVEEFEAFIATLGFSLAAPPDRVLPSHFQRLVERIRGAPAERPIAFLMLRTMQKARYDGVNLGHFGLAADCYTHFTSPIRRYPDLVVHRSLRELRRAGITDERRERLDVALPGVAAHASARERRADDAERELVQWKKVRFMASRLGEVFDGYVTGVTAFGLFVELVDHYVEGLVHVSTMADDFYRFGERTHTLVGERTKKAYRLGDAVRVQVVRVDLERRMIDLGLEDILDTLRDESEGRAAAGRAGSAGREAQGVDRERRRRAVRPGRRERRAKRRGGKA
jgi:ribonuclease R